MKRRISALLRKDLKEFKNEVLDDFDEDHEAMLTEPVPEKISFKQKIEELKKKIKPQKESQNNDDNSEGES